MATGIRCPRCEVLNRDDVQACRACGASLPVPSAASPGDGASPAPAPGTPPRILRPTQPAPLKPPSLSQLPSSSAPQTPPRPSPAPAGAPFPASPPRAVPAPAPLQTPSSSAPAGVAVAAAPAPAPAARRTPTARAPTPPPQRPGTSHRPAQAVLARPAPLPAAEEPPAGRAPPRVTVAPLLSSLVATLTDGAVIGGIALALTALLAPALAGDAAPKTQGLFGVLELVLAHPIVPAAFAGLVLLSSTLLNALVVPFAGATVGGLVGRVRLVVRSSGERPSVARAALRGFASALGAVVLLLGPLYGVWLDPMRRGAGDILSGTLPVKR